MFNMAWDHLKYTVLQRFWRSVDKDGPVHPDLKTKCWVWIAGRFDDGYGIFSENYKRTVAHRKSWVLHFGEIPLETPFVLHRCDNRSCVNPAHLFLGTHLDNSNDKIAKGRNVVPVKLTKEIARYCREVYIKGNFKFGSKGLAKKFSVDESTMRALIAGKTWKYA